MSATDANCGRGPGTLRLPAQRLFVSHSSGGTRSAFDLLNEALRRNAETMRTLDEANRRAAEYHLLAGAQQLFQQQQQIESEVFRAEQFVWYLTEDRSAEVEKFRWRYWKLAERVVSRAVARSKGTERSGSRNGAQTCCTHVMAIYESDSKARGLLGLMMKANQVMHTLRNLLSFIVSARVNARGRLLRYTNFEFCAA